MRPSDLTSTIERVVAAKLVKRVHPLVCVGKKLFKCTSCYPKPGVYAFCGNALN